MISYEEVLAAAEPDERAVVDPAPGAEVAAIMRVVDEALGLDADRNKIALRGRVNGRRAGGRWHNPRRGDLSTNWSA